MPGEQIRKLSPCCREVTTSNRLITAQSDAEKGQLFRHEPSAGLPTTQSQQGKTAPHIITLQRLVPTNPGVTGNHTSLPKT